MAYALQELIDYCSFFSEQLYFLEPGRVAHWINECLKMDFLVFFNVKKDLTSEFQICYLDRCDGVVNLNFIPG